MAISTQAAAPGIVKQCTDTTWGAGPGWLRAIGPPRAIAYRGVLLGHALSMRLVASAVESAVHFWVSPLCTR